MPFASWNRPSFALSQLSALVQREFGEQVDICVHYLNQDAALYFGIGEYQSIADGVDHLLTGIGDWVFREIAFPDAEDNSVDYFRRYYQGSRWAEFKAFIEERRAGLKAFLGELIRRHDLVNYDLLGLTSMFAQTVPSVALATMVKQANPAVVTCIGGANCEAPMGQVIRDNVPAIDYIFSGPALKSFPALVQKLMVGDRVQDCAIPGVFSKIGKVNHDLRFSIGVERDIDDYFPPDYSDFVATFSEHSRHEDSAEAHGQPVLYFETSRGCWWGQRSHCTFCGLNGLSMGYRSMSPEIALRQFEDLFSYVPWCDKFDCTDNILPKNYPEQVLQKMRTPPGASIFYEVKVPLSSREFKALASSSVTRVQPGIEAMATDTLKLMGKGTTAFQNIDFLKKCLHYGISPEWNLLIGFPGEGEATYRKYIADLPSLMHLPPPTDVFMVRFDRYSVYHAESARFGLRLRPADSYAHIYPFDGDAIERLAYFFVDDGVEHYAVVAEWYSSLQRLVQQWRDRWADRASRGNPCLTLTSLPTGEALIKDSRMPQVSTTVLDPVKTNIMLRSSSAIQLHKLTTETGLDDRQLASVVAELSAAGLIFQEGGRILSLAMPEDRIDEPGQEGGARDE